MKALYRNLPLALGIGALVVAAALAAGRVPETVEVHSDRILLSDLVGALEGASDVQVGYAPYPGHHRWLPGEDVTAALLALGQPAGAWQVPDRILVTREASRVEARLLREAVEAHFATAWPDLTIDIERIETPQATVLPAGEVEVVVDARNLPARLDGVTVKLDFLVDGRFERSQWARLRGSARGRVVVLASAVEFGEVLTRSRLAVEERELKSLEGHFTSLEAAAGSVAKRRLEAGDILERRDVKEPLLVRRGELVTLIARGPRFAISTSARARDGGGRGDSITVENMESRQLVVARVVSAGTVEIAVPGSRR